MNLYQITYTNVRTGKRETYMSVGFETKEDAERELKLLVKEAKKWRGKYNSHAIIGDISYTPSYAIGKYWRIKKVKCTPLK